MIQSSHLDWFLNTVPVSDPSDFCLPGMSPNTRVQNPGAAWLPLRWMSDMFSLWWDHLMTALPQLFPQLTKHKQIFLSFFFFTKLFNGQSQQAFLICDTKIMWLKMMPGSCYHIFSCLKGNFTQLLSLGGRKEMLFLCVQVSRGKPQGPSKRSFMTHTYVDHPLKAK